MLKIRSEFDAGGDFDLTVCGPGEIDPHAVSSILKAYLRERKYSSNPSIQRFLYLIVFISSRTVVDADIDAIFRSGADSGEQHG